MANNSASDAEQQNDAAKTPTSATAQRTSTSTAKVATKSISKAAVKPAVKAPTKAAAKPASKSAVDKKVPKKDDAIKADKKAKPKKAKQVRDSFTMPKAEYDLIAAVKKRCVAKGLAVKKSEVLRAAIIGFAAQSDATVSAALQSLEVIKTGRPPKGQK